MNLEEAEKKVNQLEKNVIDDFEKNLNHLRYEDFYSAGNNLDERIADEWFYMELLESEEEEIIQLLIDLRYYDESFNAVKLRLIKLKRVIDNRLININNQLTLIENTRNRRISYFQLAQTIDKENFIKEFYDYLKTYNFIDCTLSEISCLFSPNQNTHKIKWLGTELQLTYLISNLIDNKLLEKETHNFKYHLITKYFTNKRNNNFKAKQLSSVYSEKKDFIQIDDPIFNYFKK